jgi:hypothetical protein
MHGFILFSKRQYSLTSTTAYTRHLDVFSKKKVDLVICDHFDGGCAEAAVKAKLPFIVTSTFAFSPGTLTHGIINRIL